MFFTILWLIILQGKGPEGVRAAMPPVAELFRLLKIRTLSRIPKR